MRYVLEFDWNGKSVLRGFSSAVIAHTLLQHFKDNFAGETLKSQGVLAIPSLGDLINAPGDRVFKGAFGDETGRVTYHLVSRAE